jgi:hypothetical protein
MLLPENHIRFCINWHPPCLISITNLYHPYEPIHCIQIQSC